MSIHGKLGQNVLIVDDDPVMCAVASSFFMKRGAVQIRVANNGAEALEIIGHHGLEIDFALCDLNMPKIDGLQLIRYLKDHDFQGALVILSGEDRLLLGLAENLARQLNLNILGSLSKPLNYGELDAMLLSAPVEKAAPLQLRATPINAVDLHAAIQSGHIVAYYQPQVDVKTGRLIGVEALARWQHPERGIIPPNEFIPLAEKTNLISPLTKLMISNVINDYPRLRRLSRNLTLSINLCADLLVDISLPDWISELVDSAGLDRTKFILEVTESQLLKKGAASIETIARLSMMGYELSIDDFGTAYSNIEHLIMFPFKEIKIDHSFISQMVTDERARSSVEASVSLGKKLGLKIVAEGIETEEQRRFVAGLGVDIIQGYLVAKAMPVDDFNRWFLSRSSPETTLQTMVMR